MAPEQNDLGGSFEKAAQNTDTVETIKVDVPEMIENHQPHPVLKPDWDTSEVDRAIFNEKWQHEVDKHKQADAFDKVDEKAGLSQEFGTHARGLERE